jgi:hypothetical protein
VRNALFAGQVFVIMSICVKLLFVNMFMCALTSCFAGSNSVIDGTEKFERAISSKMKIRMSHYKVCTRINNEDKSVKQ